MPLLACALLLSLLLSAVPFNNSFATAASFSSPSPSSNLQRQCPTNCMCTVVRRHIQVDCSYASISNFPPVLPTNISQLNLNGNPIEHISRSDLQNSQPDLRYLEDLQCSDCQLTELETGSFRDFQKLKCIDLSDNDFSVISTDAFDFETLPSLRLINVKSNKRLDCTAMAAAFKVKMPLVQVSCGDDTPSMTTVRKRRNDSTDDDKMADQDASTATVASLAADAPLAADASLAADAPLAADASLAADAPLAADASMKADDSPITTAVPIGINDGSDEPGGSNVQNAEPESGFGVGTIIFLTLLSVIIFIVCFKFVFLRLKKRFCRGDRHSEEQPLDSD